ncbi:MAG TPA: toll/interleukin-1 receptor domain-containing protein [Ktedonobacteraceae bacterium]|nr:toll/interleukin-1 receptor domain-containing protein [Ktedonobacteraceae bacterium]
MSTKTSEEGEVDQQKNKNFPLKIFYCYAREDKMLRDQIDQHLSALKRSEQVVVWHDRAIRPGAVWKQEIAKNLDSAHIILLLVSANFIASDYCYGIEMKRALERHETGQVRVIPILLKPVHWEDTPLASLQVLPTDAKPISMWGNEDEALADVAKGIGKVVRLLSEVPQIADAKEAAPDRFAHATHKTNTSHTHPPASLQKQVARGEKRRWLLSGLVMVSTMMALILIAVQVAPGLNRDLRGVATPTKGVTATSVLQSNKSSATATSPTRKATPTPSVHSYPSYLPGHGFLSLFDPLSQPGHWNNLSDSQSGGTCQFSDGAFHAKEIYSDSTFFCDGPSFRDFAVEVQMTIAQGDCGGIAFRRSALVHSYYQFDVCGDGYYGLQDVSSDHYNTIMDNSTSISNWGNTVNVNHSLLVAVVARGGILTLFVNHQQIGSVQDNSYSQGTLAFTAEVKNSSTQTEVIYKNVTVWTF